MRQTRELAATQRATREQKPNAQLEMTRRSERRWLPLHNSSGVMADSCTA